MVRGLFEGWHLVILLVVVVLLFGGKKLPEVARGLGRSLRIFKSEVKEMQEEDKQRSSGTAAPEALEGRVVDDSSGRVNAPPSEHRTDN
jgi:sec-independent protein translocase protein TatA